MPDSSVEKNISARDENASANIIRQPFAWENAGDVLKYEIIIYRIDDETGKSEQVFFHETTEEENESCLIYIEPVLPPGRYRSKINVYNILGGLEEGLNTEDVFVIRQAYKPEVKNVSYPLYMRSTVYLDDFDNDGIIEIEGRNLFETDPEHEELVFTDYFLKSEKRILKPQSILFHDSDNRKVKFQFSMRSLDVGEYHFVAQDASGLHSEENNDTKFTVKFKKWMDLDIEAGYVLPVMVQDNIFGKYMDTNMFPFSAQGRITFIPYKRSMGYFGLGLKGTYSRLNADFDTYSIDGNFATAHLLFVYQFPTFKRKLYWEVHGGAGISYFNNIVFHFANNIDSEQLNTISPSFDAGLAVQFYINKRLYIEAAGDYVLTVNDGNLLGMVMPSLGLGWQF
ncbi:hypothetical protein [Treponema sp.]|uniref:hypothetical protein n=1 Tax=Treponema sp. TaxID=166 RepID=UPI0025F47796|nr:hypothetical protein [Treponema sp.]MCR5218164.1 hypothetical protein [Treponema sp.]